MTNTRRRLLLIIVLFLAIAAGAVYLWLQRRAADEVKSQTSLQQRAQKASIQGRHFPPGLHYPTLTPFQNTWGADVTLNRWLGKQPLVINVWASWCAPCKREAPLLQHAWTQNRQHVQFVGIDFRDKPPDASAFALQIGMTYPSGIDPRGAAQQTLHVMGVPTTFFIDRNGRIAYERVGELNTDQLAQGIAKIVPPRPAP